MSKQSVWTQARKEKIKQEFTNWLKAFGITWTKIHWNWHDERKEDNDGETTCSIRNGWPYKWITIHCFPPMTDEGYTDDCLDQDIIHECLHVVMEPMTKNRLLADTLFRDHTEAVTEHLTEYVWRCVCKCRELDSKLEEKTKRQK